MELLSVLPTKRSKLETNKINETLTVNNSLKKSENVSKLGQRMDIEDVARAGGVLLIRA